MTARERCRSCGGRGVITADLMRLRSYETWRIDPRARPVHCTRCNGEGLEPRRDDGKEAQHEAPPVSVELPA